MKSIATTKLPSHRCAPAPTSSPGRSGRERARNSTSDGPAPAPRGAVSVARGYDAPELSWARRSTADGEGGELRERALEGVGRNPQDAVEELFPRRRLLREAGEVRADRVSRRQRRGRRTRERSSPSALVPPAFAAGEGRRAVAAISFEGSRTRRRGVRCHRGWRRAARPSPLRPGAPERPSAPPSGTARGWS